MAINNYEFKKGQETGVDLWNALEMKEKPLTVYLSSYLTDNNVLYSLAVGNLKNRKNSLSQIAYMAAILELEKLAGRVIVHSPYKFRRETFNPKDLELLYK